MATAGQGQASIVVTADDQTKAALAQIGKNFDAVKESIHGLPLEIGIVNEAIHKLVEVAEHLVEVGRAKIELLDQLDKLSQKTGLSVEQLSVLRYQGQLANVSLDELSIGAQQLAKNMAAAAGGNKKASATFDAIGISVKDASGGLKPFDQVLGEVAEKFAHYEDGPAKAALAQRIFKDSGAAMIPLLNQGSAGLAKQKKEAEELGIVLGGEVAKNASEFNDNMTRLKATSEAAAISIGGQLLPALNKLLTNYLEFKKQGLLGAVIADAAKDVVGFGHLSGDPNADLRKLADERKQILKDQAFALKHGFGMRDFEDQLNTIDDLIRASNLRIHNSETEPAKKEGDAEKTQAPIAKDPAAGEQAEEILKRQLDQRLKRIEDFGALQKLAIEFDNQQAESAYAAGFITVQQLFDKEQEARDADLKNQLDTFDKTIAAQREFKAKFLKPEDQIKAQTAIDEAEAKGVKAQAEYDAKSAQAFEARRIKVLQVKDAYDELTATILEQEGKTREAAQLRIDIQTRAAQLNASHVDGADSQKVATNLRTQLQLAADLADVQKRYGLLTAETADAETLLGLKAQEAGTSELDALAALGVARHQALVQLAALAEASAKLATEKGTPEAAAAARALAVAFAKAKAEADPLLLKIRDIGKELGDAVASQAESSILHWQGFRSLLGAIEQDVLRIGTHELITKPLEDYLGNLFGGNGQASGGGGLIGKFLGLDGGDAGKAAASVANTSAVAANTSAMALLAAAAQQAAANLALIGAGGSGAGGFSLPGLGGLGGGGGAVNFGNDAASSIDAAAFGGWFADGGTLQPGEWGIAGENGPEPIYAGAVPLHVTPNGGGKTTHVTIVQNFAPGTNTSTVNQAARSAGDVIARAQRRNG